MRLAAVLAVLALATGCGFTIEDVSPERAPGGDLRAKKPLPFLCAVEADVPDPFANLFDQQAKGQRATAWQAQSVEPLRAGLEDALAKAGLFERFRTVGAGSQDPADVRLVVRTRDHGPTLEQRSGFRGTFEWFLLRSFVAPLFALDFVYFEVQPPDSTVYDLTCQGLDGSELGHYVVTTRFKVEVQAWATQSSSFYTQLHAMDMAAGLRGLVAKLIADDGLGARIESARARLAGPPPAPATPPPPAPAPAPIALAPAPIAPARSTGNTFVLVIGVNEYADARIPRLRFAEQDARAVYAFFATEAKSPTAEDRVQLLVGKDATRLAILKSIREHLVKKATAPEDMAILYFAGHGFADGNDTYLAGTDAQLAALPETTIPGETLRSYWSQLRAGRKVLILDACHSGGLEGVRGIGGVTVAPQAGAGSSLVIASTGPNELSSEDDRLGQGVFTIALLKGLRGEADANGDGRIDGEELSSYLARVVPALAVRANGTQTPTSSSTGAPIVLTR